MMQYAVLIMPLIVRTRHDNMTGLLWTHQKEGTPAGNIREAHGDALVLPEAQAHVAALCPSRLSASQQRLGAALAEVRVAFMPCNVSKQPSELFPPINNPVC